MLCRRNAVCVLALALLPALAAADEGVEVTLFGGVRVGGAVEEVDGGDSEFEEGVSYGIAVDVPIGDGVQIEVLISHQEAELVAGQGVPGSPRQLDLDVDYFHVGALWEWGPERRTRPFRRHKGKDRATLPPPPAPPRTRPFMTVTGGLAEFNPRGQQLDSESFFSFAVGGGAKHVLGDHVGLRFEGRIFGSWVDGSREVFCNPDGCFGRVSGSILWQFEGTVGLMLKF